jgi:DNA-binding HxlR family transcriptional regulator
MPATPKILKKPSRRLARPLQREAAAGIEPTLRSMAVLFHHRWAVPVIAELQRGDTHPGGAKFVTLLNRLRISRDSLSSTRHHLVHHDFIVRNPGYGHPMRPEYLLADRGLEFAPYCMRLTATLMAMGFQQIGLRKWILPVLFALDEGLTRFRDLKAVLPAITSRALTQALNDLQAARLIDRRVVDASPPSVLYRPNCAARRLLAVLADYPDDA